MKTNNHFLLHKFHHHFFYCCQKNTAYYLLSSYHNEYDQNVSYRFTTLPPFVLILIKTKLNEIMKVDQKGENVCDKKQP